MYSPDTTQNARPRYRAACTQQHCCFPTPQLQPLPDRKPKAIAQRDGRQRSALDTVNANGAPLLTRRQTSPPLQAKGGPSTTRRQRSSAHHSKTSEWKSKSPRVRTQPALAASTSDAGPHASTATRPIDGPPAAAAARACVPPSAIATAMRCGDGGEHGPRCSQRQRGAATTDVITIAARRGSAGA